MPRKLRKLKIDRVDLVNRGANQESHILLFKRDDSISTPPTKEDENMSEELQKQLESIQKQLDEMTTERDALLKRAETAESEIAKRDNASEEEDIWKGVPDILRKKFEAQEAETALAKAAAKVERDSRIKQECIQKASRYEYLPINPDDDWEVLKAIDTLDEKVAKRVYELFNAGDTNLKSSGMTTERGSGGNPDEGDKSPYSEIERLVNDKVSKSDHGLSFTDALSIVAREHPDLYRQYTKGVQSGKGN